MNPIFENLTKKKASPTDRLTQFRAARSWMKDNEFTAQFSHFLHPHSKSYFSFLCPIFLNQLKSLEVIPAFSPMLCRDGLLSLMWFFHQNPNPPHKNWGKGLILINRKFASFIPKPWIDWVAFYTVQTNSEPDITSDKIENIHLIFTIIDEMQCPIPSIEQKLNALIQLFGETLQSRNITITPLFNKIFNKTDEELGKVSKYFYDSMSLIDRKLKLTTQYMRWDQLIQANVTKSAFIDFNEYDFYYSDSFLVQSLLRRGASPLFQKRIASNDLSIKASFYHEFVLDSAGNTAPLSDQNLILRKMDSFIQSQIFKDEIAAFDSQKIFDDGQKFCPRSFEMLMFDLAKQAAEATLGQ